MLKSEQVNDYWNDRYSKQGSLTVGPNGYDESAQDYLYFERYSFLKDKVDWRNPLIELGCGIGRWSKYMIDNNYIGLDCSREAILSSRSKNSKSFYFYEDPSSSFEMIVKLSENGRIIRENFNVFMCTVLQHNSDETCVKIFKNISKALPKTTIYLYENKEDNAHHVKARSQQDYLNMIRSYFDVTYHEESDQKLDAVHGFLRADVMVK